jgi:hypothetical protein
MSGPQHCHAREGGHPVITMDAMMVAALPVRSVYWIIRLRLARMMTIGGMTDVL